MAADGCAAIVAFSRGNVVNLTRNPRLLARIAGLFYLIITACALFAYLHVRSQIVLPEDMARTGANLLARQDFYREGFLAAIVVVLCNPPLGVILYSLLKVVNPRVALLALVCITISTTIEAMNLVNYIAPLFTFTLPEYHAFNPAQVQALARGQIKLFGPTFTVSLCFFGVFCASVGYLILRSKFLPRILGALMMAGGAGYLLNGVTVALDLPDIPYLLLVTFVAENALALWLIAFGVNAQRWFEQAGLAQARPAIQSS